MPLAADSAFVGTWVNYSQGSILGRTLTIPAQHATALVALLVMLVGWSGISCWELTCFFLHCFRTTERARDGLFHQQQAILRSRIPAMITVIRLGWMGFQWRSNTRHSLLKSLPLMVLGLLNVASFIAAGLLVAKVTSPDSEVLARGNCGYVEGSIDGISQIGGDSNTTSIGDVLYQVAYTTFRDEGFYARSCYGRELDRRDTLCRTYKQRFISSIRMNNATCPFTKTACMSEAVSFDTGRVSSQDLGINTQQKDQLYLRKKLTCAPIAIEKYSSGWTTEERPGLDLDYVYRQPGDTYKYYNLGQGLMGGILKSNYTVVFANSTLQAQDQAYTLHGGSYYPGAGSSFNDFIPISDLNVTDGDLSLIFLSKRVAYTKPINDIWFKATRKGDAALGISDLFFPDETVTAIGCVEQYQFCNGEDCTVMSGLAPYVTAAPSINTSSQQLEIYKLLVNFLTFMRMKLVIDFLRHDLLLAKQYVYGGNQVSSALAPGQWRIEMENLHNISLAGWQAHPLLHAAPSNTVLKPGVFVHDFVIPETAPEQLHLCNNQIFRSTLYSSFSLVGLFIVCIVSVGIIALNASIPYLVQWMQQKWRFLGMEEARRAWIGDDVLHLQRKVLESRGLGPWKGMEDSVPVMDAYGEVFSRRGFEDDALQSQLGDINMPLNRGREFWEAKNASPRYREILD